MNTVMNLTWHLARAQVGANLRFNPFLHTWPSLGAQLSKKTKEASGCPTCPCYRVFSFLCPPPLRSLALAQPWILRIHLRKSRSRVWSRRQFCKLDFGGPHGQSCVPPMLVPGPTLSQHVHWFPSRWGSLTLPLTWLLCRHHKGMKLGAEEGKRVCDVEQRHPSGAEAEASSRADPWALLCVIIPSKYKCARLLFFLETQGNLPDITDHVTSCLHSTLHRLLKSG